MNSITTHVLDTSTGKPAKGVPIKLEYLAGSQFEAVGQGVTDDDGRLRTLLGGKAPDIGTYRITFDTSAYYGEAECFYPYVSIVFRVKDASTHYHVPLLLSPFGISTYRGS
ncbi:MAG: hydroxyisourate hydrolase [Polyangiaceae bacterium]